jgi:2-iminobutanoate/2-iminopropanoate deaminase
MVERPELASSAPAVGPYSAVTEANGFVFLSGQMGYDRSVGELVLGDVAVEAQLIMTNIQALLGELGLSWEDVAKTTIFLADMGDFATVNEIYGAAVGDSKPARSTVEVAALPLGARVEIELIAAR